MHLVIGNGVYEGQMGNLHVDIRCFLRSLNQAEGLVQIFACTVNAVLCPDHQTGGIHLGSSGLTNFVGATEHPGQDVDAVGEHHNALGAHLPERAGEFPLVEGIDI